LEALPSVTFKRKGRIQYQLAGQDSLWNDAETTDSLQWIRLDRLEPGAYALQVRVMDNDGEPVWKWTLRFEVAQPIYALWWFWLIGAAVVGLCVYGFVLWRIAILKRKNMEKIQQERMKIRLLTAELKAIRSQMNPHFIFNSLSAIQAKVLSEDAESAYDDLSSFSKLLRSVLDYSSREYLRLEEETGFMELYLKLEANRFGPRFHWHLEVDEELEGAGVRIPTLISQPFVENALRHGLLHKQGEQHLWITIKGEPGDFTISIKDNGVGRKRSAEINAERSKYHRSFATQAMDQRVEYLRQSGGPKVTVETVDLEDGTEVILHIEDERG
jgi:LytS/YehU family sensor histidine kinase